MKPPKDNEWRTVKLSAKVFGHISQGLYRSPAGAIKELISNAFDADASVVKIHTGFPRFDVFSCEDNGVGLSRHEFDRLMERGVGTSYKRLEQSKTTPIYNREVIGRLGIGLLALAQICTEFDLISHRAKNQAFKATLRFPPYTREEIDKLNLKSDDELIPGGEYKVEDVEFDPGARGVRIFTKYLRQGFRKRMSDLSRYGNLKMFKSQGPYKSFEDFIHAIYDDPKLNKSLNLASDYDQLLFGLALISPIPYLDEDANVMLKLRFFYTHQQRLINNNFELTVDNLKLRRPLRLPSDKRSNTAKDCEISKETKGKFTLTDGPHVEQLEVPNYQIAVKKSDAKFSAYNIHYSNAKVAGRPLRFSGYLFQQTGRLYPREIQGVLVRIREIAIGTYDAAFMTYPLAEGPRYSMVSCELIVEEGFEDALNIDRESFNTLDPHYLRMQAYLHSLLHSVVFPVTWDEEKTRNKARRATAKIDRRKNFIKSFETSSKGRFTKIKEVAEEDSRLSTPVKFSPRNETIIINVAHPLLEKALKRKKYEEIVEQLAVIFEKALLEKTPENQREVFYQMLVEVFNNQP